MTNLHPFPNASVPEGATGADADFSQTATAKHTAPACPVARKPYRRKKDGCFHFIQAQISLLREAGRLSTAAHYAQTLRSLMRFRENRDLHFDDITPQFALAYETWLREQRLCRNSSSFYLRVVRTLYNKAVAAGLTPDRQPFRAVYTGIDKTTKRAVGMADIRRIKEADLRAAPRMEFARDMFLLSFYLRGIAPVDLAFLRKTDISQGYLAYARHKTGQRMRVLVEPEIQRLFDKYATPGTKFLLPLITKEDGTERNQYRNSTRNINRHLKRLSARLHLSAPLTLYVARHSWASIAQSEHIPIGVICGAMGHDSETTTQIYLASIQTRQIDEANNLLISRL